MNLQSLIEARQTEFEEKSRLSVGEMVGRDKFVPASWAQYFHTQTIIAILEAQCALWEGMKKEPSFTDYEHEAYNEALTEIIALNHKVLREVHDEENCYIPLCIHHLKSITPTEKCDGKNHCGCNDCVRTCPTNQETPEPTQEKCVCGQGNCTQNPPEQKDFVEGKWTEEAKKISAAWWNYWNYQGTPLRDDIEKWWLDKIAQSYERGKADQFAKDCAEDEDWEKEKRDDLIARAVREERERVQSKLGFMRQWLNEDRIETEDKMVTTEELAHWILP